MDWYTYKKVQRLSYGDQHRRGSYTAFEFIRYQADGSISDEAYDDSLFLSWLMESMLWELGLMMDLNFTALGHWERSYNIWLAYTLSLIAKMTLQCIHWCLWSGWPRTI